MFDHIKELLFFQQQYPEEMRTLEGAVDFCAKQSRLSHCDVLEAIRTGNRGWRESALKEFSFWIGKKKGFEKALKGQL